jgi:hypothetical protein
LAVGLSLGNPATIGVDAGVSILDLRQNRDGGGGFGHRGTFTLKLHRRLTPNTAAALGLNNLLNWGRGDVPVAYYGVVSHRFPSGRIYASVGLGTGDFRSERDVVAGRKSVGVFASVAYSVSKPIRVFTEWTGQDMAMGTSLVPLRGVPVVVTISVLDLTGVAGDGPRPAIGFSYAFSILPKEYQP